MSVQKVEDDHEKCRKRVCVVCYGKGSRSLSQREIGFIKVSVIEGYDIDNPDFPAGLCTGCQIKMCKKMKDLTVALPQVQSYDPERPVLLRSCGSCSCRICKVAKSTINNPSTARKKRGRPKATETSTGEQAVIKICSTCFSKIGKGCSHDCTRRAKVSNIQQLLSDTPTSSQRVASRIIKETETPFLATMGNKPKPITPARGALPKKQLFSTEDMSLIQNDLSLSNRQVLLLAEDLRIASGSRRIIETGMKDGIRKINRQLGDCFEARSCNFAFENAKLNTREKFYQNVVVCNDLEGLVDKIIEERQINEGDMIVRIGLDGGGGFVKVCLSIFHLPSTDNIQEEDCRGKRRLSKKFKDSGVKKVFVIAIVPDIQENFVNVKRLWLETGIDKLSRRYYIATDLKLCNVLLGLMSHGSTHPCCWCDITKGELDRKGKSRTIKSLTDKFWEYFDSRAEKKDAKDYGNVIHLSVFAGNVDESSLVILSVPPPELHLMIGPVNKMFDELSKVWADSETWIQRLHVKREEYHGGSFNGNDSRKLLKSVNMLEEICPAEYRNYIEAFKSFNEVVTACYGNNLAVGYKEKIAQFKNDYMKLNISVTPKVHAVLYHVPEFCELMGIGLAPFSEQTVESLHHDFTKIWNSYKVKDTTHEEYAERLLQCVIAYNSQHL